MNEKNKKIIMLISNEKDLLNTIKIILFSEGYDVLSCQNGQDAMKALKLMSNNNSTLDLIITSAELPDIAAMDLVKVLNAFAKKVPIIFFVGLGNNESVFQILKSGGGFFLYKPFSKEHFINKINEVMDYNTS